MVSFPFVECSSLQRAAHCDSADVSDAMVALPLAVRRAVAREAALGGCLAFLRSFHAKGGLPTILLVPLLADAAVSAAIAGDAESLTELFADDVLCAPPGLVARVFRPFGGPLDLESDAICAQIARALERVRKAEGYSGMETDDGVVRMFALGDSEACEPSSATLVALAKGARCDALRALLGVSLYGEQPASVHAEVIAASDAAVRAAVAEETGCGLEAERIVLDDAVVTTDAGRVAWALVHANMAYDRVIPGGVDALAEALAFRGVCSPLLALPGLATALVTRLAFSAPPTAATNDTLLHNASLPLAAAISGMLPAGRALLAAAHVLSAAGADPTPGLVAWCRALLGAYGDARLLGCAVRSGRPYYVRVLSQTGLLAAFPPDGLVVAAGLRGSAMVGALAEGVHAEVPARLDMLVRARASVSDVDDLATYLHAVARYVADAKLELSADQQAILLANTAVSQPRV